MKRRKLTPDERLAAILAPYTPLQLEAMHQRWIKQRRDEEHAKAQAESDEMMAARIDATRDPANPLAIISSKLYVDVLESHRRRKAAGLVS